MAAVRGDALLGPLRVALALLGVGGGVGGVGGVATTPPAPPGSDGFVTGLAYAFGLLTSLLGVLMVGVGLSVPAPPASRAGVLAYSRAERIATWAGGGVVLAVLLLVFAVGPVLRDLGLAPPAPGPVLGIALAGGALVVVLVLGWRLARAAVGALRRGAARAADR